MFVRLHLPRLPLPPAWLCKRIGCTTILKDATVIIIAVNDEMTPFMGTVKQTVSNFIRQKVGDDLPI